MTRANRSRETNAVRRLSPVGATLATLLMAGLPFPAPAAHLKSVYSFTGGKDGAFPATANLMQAADGSLYGTTAYGGDVNCNEPYSNEPGCGVVFKVDKRGNEKVLHIFRAGSDGAEPYAGLIQDASGNLYGTTIFGGTGATCSCGVVFKIDASGKETVLYSFTGGADGGYPVAGLMLDATGNLYGTASAGGQLTQNCDYFSGCGVVFKLDKKGHETVLYTFTGGADGYSPEYGPLVADTAGNLYGTTLHRRVAFPLPGVPLAFRWIRPKAYPENPATLGEHLRKRRSQTGQTQKDIAAAMGVNAWTYLLWETDRTVPTVRFYPRIFRFLGYDPFAAAGTLGNQLRAKRRELGLTIAAAAKFAGVDEGTFRRWERDEWKPRMSHAAVQAFLATPVPLDVG